MKTVGTAALARHTRELAALLGMGYALVEALARVRERADAPFAEVARRLEEEVRRGRTLGVALEGLRPALPETFVRAVQVGEETGDLPRALQAVADLLERAEWRRMGVRAALAYPRLLVTFGGLVGLLILWLGGALFGDLFPYLGANLPAPTRLMLWVSGLARSTGFLAAAFLALAGFHALATGALGLDGLRLRTPVLGTWIRRQETVTCLDWLDYLLSHRVPLDEALRLASGACDSPAFRAGVLGMADEVSRGGSLSAGGVFPQTAAWLVGQAERREFPPGLVGRISRTLEREVDLTSRRGLAVLEPLALLAIGAGLAFMLASFFLPLYGQMTGNMG